MPGRLRYTGREDLNTLCRGCNCPHCSAQVFDRVHLSGPGSRSLYTRRVASATQNQALVCIWLKLQLTRLQLHTTFVVTSVCSAAQRRTYVSNPAEEALQLHSTESTDSTDKLAAERLALQAALARCPSTQSICLLGIDPDASGALAVMHWDLAAGLETPQLGNATLQVHDMPLESVPVGKRLRKYVLPPPYSCL